VLGVRPTQNTARVAGAARRQARVQLDRSTRSLRRAALAMAREWRGRLVDASTGGMGIAIPAAGAAWVRHDELVAILIEPGSDWVVGALRRIHSVEGEIRLGVQMLAARPRAVWLEAEAVQRESVWDESMGREREYGEHYRRAILLAPLETNFTSGELLLPRGAAVRGARFGVPLPSGDRHIRITGLHYDGAHYQRAGFEAPGARKA
jgi:hypothetical protein